MNIQEIATACADRIEPTIKKSISLCEGSANPEIKIGMNALVERREKIIGIVSTAITDAIVADRMTRESVFQNFVKMVADAESNPLYDDSRDDLLKDFMDTAQEIITP